jgi:hypothetical protein
LVFSTCYRNPEAVKASARAKRSVIKMTLKGAGPADRYAARSSRAKPDWLRKSKKYGQIPQLLTALGQLQIIEKGEKRQEQEQNAGRSRPL